MKELLELRSVRAGLVFALLIGAALCTDRLFGIHGVESALVLGALLPPWAAVIGVRVLNHARQAHRHLAPTELLWRALSSGWLLVAVPTAMLALNSLRVRNCAPVQGAMFIVLGPAAATTLASTWGLVASGATRRIGLATTLALLGPLTSIGLGLVWFYTTPAIFAYGHFFGYFPGTLYDEALQLPGPLLTLRAVTLTFTVGLACLWVGHYDATEHRLRVHPQRSRLFGLAAMLALGIVIAAESDAESLGHRTSGAWIAERLGRTIEGERCRVVVPRELNHAEARRLADDCEFRVDQMERVIGVTQRERVSAFFFRSPDEKRALMGAATTSIAKPWRNEIYLQLAGWPHPVLAHEIAHIVAGNLAPGPLHVAAGLGGLWPEASLIEGMAVSAAWDANDGLTPHQWAHAMDELGLAPRITDLLGTGFLGQPKERAYTLAGSFLRFLKEIKGPKAVRDIYRSGNVEDAGFSLAQLESEWLAFVRAAPLPDRARALASHRFSRSSIFSSVCPHTVANLRITAAGDLASNDTEATIKTCHALLEVDPADVWARTTLVGTLARAGRLDDATRELGRLVGPPAASPPSIWSAQHALADAAWRRGNLARARVLYSELIAAQQSEDVTRLLEAKLLGVDSDEPGRSLLLELLVGRDGSPPDPATAVHLAREIAGARGDGLGTYLEGRQLFNAQRFKLAAELAMAARHAGLPTVRLQLAALRVEATSLFALGDLSQAERLWHLLARLGDAAHALEAADWEQRIRWSRQRRSRLMR